LVLICRSTSLRVNHPVELGVLLTCKYFRIDASLALGARLSSKCLAR
jgi:hypothetical protein